VGLCPTPHEPLKSKSTFAFGKSKPYGLPTFFVGARLDLNFQSEKLSLFGEGKLLFIKYRKISILTSTPPAAKPPIKVFAQPFSKGW
jgi:hypothetical protein